METCYIVGAGNFTARGLTPAEGDLLIAADGGYDWLLQSGLTPQFLLGDLDSLGRLPVLPPETRLLRYPVEKDDTDMMLAIKEGLGRGETEFHLYGGMGGRTDHTIANLQGLLYLADHGARGWLYGDRERFTAIRDGSITLPAREKGIVSVFCMGADAQGVTIEGGQYTVHDAVLTSSFPLGVSNHYVGNPVRVTVTQGSLLIALIEKE